MRCDKCGIKLDDGMKFCYECGTSVNEKEQIREAEESLSAFFESRENLMKKNVPKEKDFVYTTFGKVLFAFVGFGILAMTVSFLRGSVLSGIVAVVMTCCALVSYLVGAEVLSAKSRSVKYSVAFVAFLFAIPYFCTYNLEMSKAVSGTASNVETEPEGADEAFQQEDVTEEVSEKDEEIDEDDATNEDVVAELADGTIVYTTPTGKKYHINEACAGVNAISGVLEELDSKYEPCKKCAK